MRYKKGSIVEVLSKNEVPSGSWRCAEIICGNGHNYTVRYEMDPGATDEAIVERVSRKSIRPCPPPVKLSENCVPGDVVEVFQNFSWKMATVSKVLGRNCFLVRLLGSSHEFKVSKVDLRVRQSWQGGKWFVIGKLGVGNCEDGKCSERSTLKYNQLSSQVKKTNRGMNFPVNKELCAAKSNNNFQESHIVSSRTLKRGLPDCYSQVDAPARTSQKFRVIAKEGRCRCLLAAYPSPLPEKIYAVLSHREMQGEKNCYTSFNSRTTHFTKVDVEREKPSGAVGCLHAISLEPNDAENITCSVASCSITSNDSFKLRCNFSRGPVEDTEGDCSDAESACHRGFKEGNCFLPSQVELAEEIHRLELDAYRCTIEALHALGPLSWEQETLVTNLRLSLNISNDEHLMELRNLVSTATSMPLMSDILFVVKDVIIWGNAIAIMLTVFSLLVLDEVGSLHTLLWGLPLSLAADKCSFSASNQQQIGELMMSYWDCMSSQPLVDFLREQLNTFKKPHESAAAADADEKSLTSDHGNQSATAAADEKSSTSNPADTELKPAETESSP
ncbi:hypothetical protein TEA_010585 [Camellia sinensis var. sinensis]|uniref:ENT domain-containing protein n=1 Tax=Camellia sinensis var. sinensis TaxID=542762 RepID=A0A4S4E1U9_CAMSN|nr:hypothetical protein TEA_010585 [Camellia sinensis var. sinensis]